MHSLGNANPAEVPWFVYAILGSYFVFFNLFPINMIFQYKKVGKWANYFYGERAYIMLSLIAKTVLAWLVFSGVMQPAREYKKELDKETEDYMQALVILLPDKLYTKV